MMVYSIHNSGENNEFLEPLVKAISLLGIIFIVWLFAKSPSSELLEISSLKHVVPIAVNIFVGFICILTIPECSPKNT